MFLLARSKISPRSLLLPSRMVVASHRLVIVSRSYASAPIPPSMPQLPPGFEKLAHHPSALTAISNLIQVMGQNGLDVTTGEKPSMWKMVKLVGNPEVKAAVTKVMEELENAGIDISPEKLRALIVADKNFFNK